MISVLSLLVISSNEWAQCYRILALFPVSAGSHFFMAESLMKGLATRGHRVDVVSHFPLEVSVPNYTDISLKGTLPISPNVSIAFMQSNPFVSVKRMAHAGGLTACSLLGHPKLQEILRDPLTYPPYDLVIVEVFMAPCYLAVGRHLSLPMVGVSALRDWLSESIGSPQATAFVPNVFSGYSQGMNFWERLVNIVEHAVYSMQLNYYTECQNEFVRKHVDPAIPDVRQLYGDLALLLVNSHHSMQRIGALAPAVVEVAGLHLNDDAGKLDSVSSHKRIGNLVEQKRVRMHIIHDCKDRVDNHPRNLRNSHKNVKAFMSHGGIFGIQEAIYSAVPLIGIPLFGDQQANVDTFARTKVLYPLSFSDITANNVERARRTDLEDPSYSNGIEKLRTLFLDRPMKPFDAAIFWIEYVARHGNSMRSPGLHIAWWQRDLLDVYVFLVSSCALVLYTSLVLFARKPMQYYRHYLGQGARHGAADSSRLQRRTTETPRK